MKSNLILSIERLKNRLVYCVFSSSNESSYMLKLIFSLIFILKFSMSFQQTLDSDFESISLMNHINPYVIHKSTNSKFIGNNDSIVLIYAAFIVKQNGKFISDKQNNLTAIRKFPDTCRYFAEGTKAILIGCADNQNLEDEKHRKCVSFKINEMPKLGDTAFFEFNFLSIIENRDLQPQIYFSKDLKVSKRLKIKNFKQFKKGNLVSFFIEKNKVITSCEIKLPIDQETSEYQWIHIVNDYKRHQKGLLLQKNFSIIPKSDDGISNKIENNLSIIQVFFDFDSYTINSEGKILLDSISNLLKSDKNLTLTIQGMSDRSGSLDYNIRLANSRSQRIFEYLIKNDASKDRLEMLSPTIGSEEDEKFNRVCVIEVHKLM